MTPFTRAIVPEAILRGFALLVASLACYATFIGYPRWTSLSATRQAISQLEAENEQSRQALARQTAVLDQVDFDLQQLQLPQPNAVISTAVRRQPGNTQPASSRAFHAPMIVRLQAIQELLRSQQIVVLQVQRTTVPVEDGPTNPAQGGRHSQRPSQAQTLQLQSDFGQMQAALQQLSERFSDVHVQKLTMLADQGGSCDWSIELSIGEASP